MRSSWIDIYSRYLVPQKRMELISDELTELDVSNSSTLDPFR